MAAGTCGAGGLSGRRVADGCSRGPSGRLPGIVERNVVELGLAHTREKRLHELVLALTADIGLHRCNEVLLAQPGQTWHSRALADAALAVTPRAGNDLVTGPLLVGPDGASDVLGVLTCEARPSRSDADTLLAVAVGAQGDGRLPRRRIADEPGLRSSRGLPRIKQGDVVELR